MSGLVPEWRIGDLVLTDYPFAVPFGSDYGTPDVTVQSLTSFLTDGDLELTSRRGNRTLTLPVLIDGSDMAALAEAEADLVAACDKAMNRLYVDPGDGHGPPFVFRVFQGQVTFQRDDDYEQSNYRLYQVTWRALPWPQSSTKVTVSALAASGSTTTSINAFSATTGITGAFDGVAVTPSVTGGAVTVASTTAVSGLHTLTATIAGAITTSPTNLLFLDWKAGAGNEDPTLSATGDGIALPPVASAPSPTAGYTRSWFYVAASSIATSVVFTLTTYTAGAATAPSPADAIRSLTMDQFSRTDVRPTIGTAKQQVRTLEIAGSAPTVGTIVVQHATSSLGNVLLYTCPDYNGSPACRPLRVSGNGPNADASTASGFYDIISTTPSVFDIPVSMMQDGEHLIVGLVGYVNTFNAVSTYSWSITPRMNSTDIGTAVTGSIALPDPTGYAFLRLGTVHLPLMDAAPGASSVNRISLSATNAGNQIRLDELYLINLTTGRLSQFSLGSGTAASGGDSKRLWLDSPAPENDGLGRLLRGHAADRSDAFSAWPSAASPTIHDLRPGVVKVFSVATNPSTAVDVSYEYYPAGHSSAPV